MKHLLTFENYVFEFFDFEKVFDIDEEVLSYVFSEMLEKFPNIQIKLEEIDNKKFQIDLLDESDKNNLSEVFEFLKKKNVYSQIQGHFDVMDFIVTQLLSQK